MEFFLYFNVYSSILLLLLATVSWTRTGTLVLSSLRVKLWKIIIKMRAVYWMMIFILQAWIVDAKNMMLWAVTRAWPVPMPVHFNSSLLPTLFSTSCDMDAPCIPTPDQKIESFNLTSIQLNGTMCFSLKRGSPCIRLKRDNLTNWKDPLVDSRVGWIYWVQRLCW